MVTDYRRGETSQRLRVGCQPPVLREGSQPSHAHLSVVWQDVDVTRLLSRGSHVVWLLAWSESSCAYISKLRTGTRRRVQFFTALLTKMRINDDNGTNGTNKRPRGPAGRALAPRRQRLEGEAAVPRRWFLRLTKTAARGLWISSRFWPVSRTPALSVPRGTLQETGKPLAKPVE